MENCYSARRAAGETCVFEKNKNGMFSNVIIKCNQEDNYGDQGMAPF
jgi:hypothetical protein